MKRIIFLSIICLLAAHTIEAVTAVVPNIIGMTSANANTALTNVGLVPGTVTGVSGVVTVQSPAAGIVVALGSSVAYTIIIDCRDPGYLPLGVYWAGEFTYNNLSATERWAKIDNDLDGLASHNVNTVWLTKLSVSETATFARHAAIRGISVVASSAQIGGEYPAVLNGNHQTIISTALNDWGDAPKPLAWGLGDEPGSSILSEMTTYVQDWHTYAPGEPVTSVITGADLANYVGAGFDALSTDCYPFFSVGNPDGYAADQAATVWLSHTSSLVAGSVRPWMMGQAFQGPEDHGPFQYSTQGNVVYLPGGCPGNVMPTPDQIKYQALSAFAIGSKGMFYFIYRWLLPEDPSAAPSAYPAAVTVQTDSGSPVGMVHEDGSTTPQYEALSVAYGWLKPQLSLLSTLVINATSLASISSPSPKLGNVISTFTQTGTGNQYMLVISYYQQATMNVKIALNNSITSLTDLETSLPLTIKSHTATIVNMAAATAKIYSINAPR